MSLLRKLSVVSLFSLVALMGGVAAAQSPEAAPLRLLPGWPVVLPADGALQVQVQDPTVVRAQLSPTGEVKLSGLREGETRVTLLGAPARAPRTVTVVVEASGWDLVEVVVAATDVEEETAVDAARLTTRWVPRALVTQSQVRARDLRYLLGHKSLVPLAAGDLVNWSMFERRRR